MGPCRLTKEGQTGICGATIDTIQARNLIRAIAAGSAAHSDHGRDMAFTLKAVANGETEGYTIRDVAKLRRVAAKYDIPIEGRSPEEIADELADLYISQYGQQRGQIVPIKGAPPKRQKLWEEQGVIPRGIDREVVEALHRTHIGDDQDPEHILHHAIRTSLADGWGGSMMATDISDILFGTPAPLLGEANLGVLKDDMVNVLVHGHEPTLSEMIVAASQTPEIIEYAKEAGAKGVNLAGICCTANEILMRQGIPAAGNFLHQELSILTGAVEAMVVDVQCIMQALVALADNFHTKIITTSPKVKIKGATHIEFDDGQAMTIAKNILRVAIDNYKERGQTRIPDAREKLIPGFSHEYINYMLGGRPHPWRSGHCWLQQSSQQAGLLAHLRHPGNAQERCVGRRDRLRRHRQRQVGAAAGRGRIRGSRARIARGVRDCGYSACIAHGLLRRQHPDPDRAHPDGRGRRPWRRHRPGTGRRTGSRMDE
jgi:carbon-monoxide dehydrogenase catalytic subunit